MGLQLMEVKIMKHTLIKKEVITFKDLMALYNDSALTLEGLALESVLDWFNMLLTQTEFKNETVTYYVTSGATMNKYLGLHGYNCYQDNLTIVSFKLSSMVNPMATAIPRFSYGGRWFDDIVDNNLSREGLVIETIKRKWGK